MAFSYLGGIGCLLLTRQSSVDGDQLSIGLEGFGEAGDNTLKGMLSQPFRRSG